VSVARRKHIGWEVTCDAYGCSATTATDGPLSHRRTAALALVAAITLSWVEIRIDGETRWVCPMHQTFDPRLGRWVAQPLVTDDRPRRQPLRSKHT
jgi:hypothetical protein